MKNKNKKITLFGRPRSNIVILTAIAIACIALMLSILSYQFFIIASNKIVDIASHEVRSNVRIEVHDISQILANKLQTVGSLLQTLTESPAIHNNEYKRADCTFWITHSRQA
ncbi:MAG TPA: hypothetical protein VEH06_10820 [Candidatus Bathyarchaeia archaeon]|nr:hypothetical protein [Candidatus Bathyarchaeia archaeon]